MTETIVGGTITESPTFIQKITPNAASDLPEAHILHEFNDETQGCRIYKNGISNELTFNMNAEDAPTLSASYITDYPIFEEDSLLLVLLLGLIYLRH